jgi:FkbM family methyltransferase
MKLGPRSFNTLAQAVFQKRHYHALGNMFRHYATPGEALRRYLSGSGPWPWRTRLYTPMGPRTLTLRSWHDLLTLNEIFCRGDYALDPPPEIVVDIGANIGLASLYALTRNRHAQAWLFEPVATNIAEIPAVLQGFEHRYQVITAPVAPKAGPVDFGIEPSGRYGGIGVSTGQSLTLQAISMGDALTPILAQHARIDWLKLDTEGSELALLEAIPPEMLTQIETIYLESLTPLCFPPQIQSLFNISKNGPIYCLRRLYRAS